ncbi:hypothetical protein PC117_g25416 [Phytophthora cactorum]|uniref:Uncharacterized protein n=1 Tax=Phytophthora cactorum TaxID=29920 RepID=A0A8T1ASA0_9STRA|nr:hypothetical protein PC117_g25416 [Phytophthora cactorum]
MRTDLAILVRYKTPASDSLKFEINLYLARVSTIKTKGKCTIRAYRCERSLRLITSLLDHINLFMLQILWSYKRHEPNLATADEVEMLQYSVFTSSGRLANMFTYPFRSKRQVSRIVNLGVRR